MPGNRLGSEGVCLNMEGNIRLGVGTSSSLGDPLRVNPLNDRVTEVMERSERLDFRWTLTSFLSEESGGGAMGVGRMRREYFEYFATEEEGGVASAWAVEIVCNFIRLRDKPPNFASLKFEGFSDVSVLKVSDRKLNSDG